jgi:tetratricopeptide (TPR) repeat protein
MDFQKINIAIAENNFSNLSIAELEKLIIEFPYCGNFKVALSKIHQSNNDHQLNKSIKSAAPFVNNRSAFFKFLFTETLKITVNKIEEEIDNVGHLQPNPIDSFKEEEEKNIIQETSEPEQKTEITDAPEIIEKGISSKNEIIEEKATPKKTSSELTEETLQEIEIEKSPDVEQIDKNQEEMLRELEKQILSSAVSTSIIKEASEPAENITPEEPDKIMSITGKNTFSGWLKNISQNKFDPKEQKEKKQLIEKFIQNDPQITPKQTAFFSVAEKAKLSLAEDETFVTETLAKIYAQQGNNSKAIKAYEILILKNPEKKTLFAARIKELKTSVKK